MVNKDKTGDDEMNKTKDEIKKAIDEILDDPEFDGIADEVVKTGHKMYFNTGVKPENSGKLMKYQVIRCGTMQIEFYLEREPESNLIFRHLQSNFVTNHIKSIVSGAFGDDVIKTQFAKDEHLNGIGLKNWDMLTYRFNCDKAMRELGDYATLAGKVCVLKAAARIIAKS